MGDRLLRLQKVKMASRILGRFRSQIAQYRSYASQAGPSAQTGDHGEGVKLWFRLTYFVALPGVAICFINAQKKEAEHKEHPRDEFVPYEHLRLRSKGFPWGNGNKSLFHNSHMNCLPEGYEDEI